MKKYTFKEHAILWGCVLVTMGWVGLLAGFTYSVVWK